MNGVIEVNVVVGDRNLLAGQMYSHRHRGSESASFVYDSRYLADPDAYSLDPALPLGTGTLQTPVGRRLFGAFADSSPDRWGRTLIRRAERARARAAAAAPRSTSETDLLLGVRDDLRQGALRFRLGDQGPFLATEESGVPVLTDLPTLLDIAARAEWDTANYEDLRRLLRAGKLWRAEQRAFAARDLSQVDYVYLWADGIHMSIRLEEHKLCLLVMIGVRADGRKELIALADGYRESAESWTALLRDCARRGMRAPVLAVGDGALGFWAALREVFPQAREGRCWFHKTANVLAALPKSAHPGAKKALAEIWGAEDKEHALAAVKAFEAAYGAKFPKATAKITDDLDQLLAFYDYPAEHWVHLRTTNPIESTFATVRHRTKVTKGPGSRAAGLAMAFKLIESAQDRWRAVNAPHLVALVRAGAIFTGGKLAERPEEAAA